MIGVPKIARSNLLVESQPVGWVPAVGVRASAENLPDENRARAGTRAGLPAMRAIFSTDAWGGAILAWPLDFAGGLSGSLLAGLGTYWRTARKPPQRTFKIGFQDNPPLQYVDAQGRPDRPALDLIDTAARREGDSPRVGVHGGGL